MPLSTLSMSDTQFQKLRKIVYERAGISFQDSKKYVLESRLSRRLEELDFDNYDQYLNFLTMGPYQTDEFQEMFNRITINETSFFRNEPQLDVFERKILPGLLEARSSKRQLRLWSAACSSGEEPYTLAIMLHRSLGVRLADWRIEILGTDISEKVLKTAIGGVYPHYAVRTVNSMVLSRYFREENNQYVLDPTIRSMVHFEKLNLKDGMAARRFGKWDVIFCRNVMIYFDDDMKTHCAKLFHEQLENDGTLFIGHSETLRNLEVAFEVLNIPQGFAYVKTDKPAVGFQAMTNLAAGTSSQGTKPPSAFGGKPASPLGQNPSPGNRFNFKNPG